MLKTAAIVSSGRAADPVDRIARSGAETASSCRRARIGDRLRSNRRRPLGSIQTKPVAAFVPAYATAMFVCDSITAILLFVQFSILRSRAILVIASGYLFTALILIPWILAFPGVFASNVGLIGGLQTTSWLYFSQHAGLPLFAIWSALSKGTRPTHASGARRHVRRSP